ncbi:unnamed protein product, partial [Mesorhabditis belari]|uniref:Serine carboxypeptidase n=1 Tax=Mesorhabditis belari TaxID=2138241 RepID=A0AAF3F6E3_9BILA
MTSRFPGLGFTPPFKSYSGYLDAKNKNGTSNWKMFYWFTESKSEPEKDPLAIYYSGGPGCSGVGEAFEEMGPFYVNYGGDSLYENVYAWNAKANVLYLDSPIGVGFSYDTENHDFSFATDDQTAEQNYLALFDFFTRVAPEYATRDFYLTGSSYSGVWQPMLADLLVQSIVKGEFPNENFKGFAIGNGYLDVNDLNNALVLWDAYHGKISLSDWEEMKEICYINGVMKLWDLPEAEGIDAYMFYEECWGYQGDTAKEKKTRSKHSAMKKFKKGFERKRLFYNKPNQDPSVNTAKLLNVDSSDNEFGYPCWQYGSLSNYMNKAEVQTVFQIADDWRVKSGELREWNECSNLVNTIDQKYTHNYPTMSPFFDRIFENWKKPLKILIYNGDVDTVCNYLGDQKFVKRLAKEHDFVESDRTRWFFRGLTAGWQQRYAKNQIIIDVLTVKGAGHFVPNDRGGASVQMITAFLNQNPPNYDKTLIDPTPNPIEFEKMDKT